MPEYLSPKSPFKFAVARRVLRGAIQWTESGGYTVEDIYSVVMPSGAPPVGQRISRLGADVPANVSGLPARGAKHPEYPVFVVSSIRPEPVVSDAPTRVWRVAVSYVPRKRKTGTDGSGTGVLGVEFYINSITVPVPLANSAGELFNPPPAREVASPCVRVRLRSRTAPAHLMRFQGAVNSRDLLICGILFPAYTARCLWTCASVEDDDGATGLRDYTIDIQGNFAPAPESGVFANGGATLASVFHKAAAGDAYPLLAGWAQLIADAGYCYKRHGSLVRFKVAAAEDLSVQQDSPVPKFLGAGGAELADGADVRYFVILPGPAVEFAGLNLPEDW